jgi:hypothetical protein
MGIGFPVLVNMMKQVGRMIGLEAAVKSYLQSDTEAEKEWTLAEWLRPSR